MGKQAWSCNFQPSCYRTGYSACKFFCASECKRVADMSDLPHVDPEMIKSLVQEYMHRPDLVQNSVREATIKKVVGHLSEMYPKHNIMLCHPRHDASKLVSSWKEHFERRVHDRTYGFDVYIFSHGTFILDGDGGYINWRFEGNFKRDAHNPKKVYFNPRAPSSPRAPS